MSSNPISKLNEVFQPPNHPRYRIISVGGHPEKPKFSIELCVQERLFYGEGDFKKGAKRSAAQKAFESLILEPARRRRRHFGDLKSNDNRLDQSSNVVEFERMDVEEEPNENSRRPPICVQNESSVFTRLGPRPIARNNINEDNNETAVRSSIFDRLEVNKNRKRKSPEEPFILLNTESYMEEIDIAKLEERFEKYEDLSLFKKRSRKFDEEVAPSLVNISNAKLKNWRLKRFSQGEEKVDDDDEITIICVKLKEF